MNEDTVQVVKAAFENVVREQVSRSPLMEPFTPSPFERAARSVEARWERNRKINLMRRLGFAGTDSAVLNAYHAIRSDVPPTTCDCDLCR